MMMYSFVMRSESLSDARAQLSTLLDAVDQTHERVAITRNGRIVAVLVSPDDLEALEETLELLGDPVAMREIEEAREQLRRGEGIGLDELRTYLTATADSA